MPLLSSQRLRLRKEEESVGRMRINGLVFPYMLDTGAVVTLIPESMYESIVRNSKGVLKTQTCLQTYPYSLQSASGPLPIVGCFRAKLQIGQTVLHQQEIVVARMSQNKCLLGRDLISRCPEYQIHFDKIKQAILDSTVGVDTSTWLSNLSDITEVSESEVVDTICSVNVPPCETSNVTDQNQAEKSESEEVTIEWSDARVIVDENNELGLVKNVEGVQPSAELDEIEKEIDEEEVELVRQNIRSKLEAISAKSMSDLTPSREYLHSITMQDPNQASSKTCSIQSTCCIQSVTRRTCTRRPPQSQ